MTKYIAKIITDSEVSYETIKADKCYPNSDYSCFRFENEDGTLVARIVVSPRHTIVLTSD